MPSLRKPLFALILATGLCLGFSPSKPGTSTRWSCAVRQVRQAGAEALERGGDPVCLRTAWRDAGHESPEAHNNEATRTPGLGRRQVLAGSLGATAAWVAGSLPVWARGTEEPLTPDGKLDLEALLYTEPAPPSIFLVASNSQLVKSNAAELRDALQSDVVLVGEHHNSKEDHRLQLSLLSEFAKAGSVNDQAGRLVLGLEQVEQRFQPVLDAFVAGDIGLEELYVKTEWATRWVWPFKLYAPVLSLARDLGYDIVALNTELELQRQVPLGGLDVLSREERQTLVPDATGFVSTTQLPGFPDYVNSVIMPSYDTHARSGWLDAEPAKRSGAEPLAQPQGQAKAGDPPASKPTPGNFFAARALRDEAMCVPIARRLAQRPKARAIVLVGADHVKFEYGMSVRMARLLGNRPPRRRKTDTGFPRVVSIMLNPSPEDTLSSDPARLSLALTTTGSGSRPLKLADVVLYSVESPYKVQLRPEPN